MPAILRDDCKGMANHHTVIISVDRGHHFSRPRPSIHDNLFEMISSVLIQFFSETYACSNKQRTDSSADGKFTISAFIYSFLKPNT